MKEEVEPRDRCEEAVEMRRSERMPIPPEEWWLYGVRAARRWMRRRRRKKRRRPRRVRKKSEPNRTERMIGSGLMEGEKRTSAVSPRPRTEV